MENLKEILSNVFSNANVRRWIVEGCICIALGISVACITFNVLNKDKKELTVSAEAAASPVTEDGATTEVNGEGLPADDPDADVVIEVVEGPSDDEVDNTTAYGYAPEIADWSAAEIDAAIQERSEYITKTKYQSAVCHLWESQREVTDVACYCMYLFNTDTTVYTAADFENMSPEIIHLAKNEIYARHGYSFKDQDLYNYFMAQIWYTPSVLPADFSEDVFTETEVKNLDMLNEIDTL